MWRYVGLVLVVLAINVNCARQDPDALWPEIEPFETGYLRVSDIHEIYYELCGNPEGRPVFVLHGGPGGSCSPYMRRFCNPDKFLIVLHDQRGAGQSKPYAELQENTTWHLVDDIERLRTHLELDSIILFGGSWGATLGLAYAEKYPENVSGMVLRGVFTATQEDIDHFYNGGAAKFFPETYDRMLAALPEPTRRPLPEYFLELLQTEDSAARHKYSVTWAQYELKMAMLEVPDELMERITRGYEEESPYSFALFENYYMANHCFLEEGQLLRDAPKLRDIPLVMINGRYDMLCPPIIPYRLHQMLPKSKLVIPERAGHWMGDQPVERALVRAIKEFE